MPKRVLDFDAIWASDKLASCAPWARAEYTWMYGLADCNGSFELTNQRVIFGRVYAIREDISIEQLSRVLNEFHAKGLLFLWEENGKKYGHWTGSDVPGRLPPPSWRARLERLAPSVPRVALEKYLCAFSRSRLKSSTGEAQAQDSDLDLDREVDAAAAPSPADQIKKAEPLVGSPTGASAFHHPRLRISPQLDAKLAQEFPALPEPARHAEYERMAAKLEEAGEAARHAGNYARAWLRGLSGASASAGGSVAPLQRQLWVGRAARPSEFGVCVKPAVLERIRARDAAAKEGSSAAKTESAEPSKTGGSSAAISWAGREEKAS